jgi:serine/threonine protein kinase
LGVAKPLGEEVLMLRLGYRVEELQSDGNDESGPKDPLVGTKFGAYQVFKSVAKSALADTYLAYGLASRGRRKIVALDIVREEVSQTEGFAKRFADQARTSMLPEHPNLVRVCDHGVVDRRYYLANEYSAGRRLDVVLRGLRRLGVRPGVRFSVALARDIARSLGQAHAVRDDAGRRVEVVHGDIRPGNIAVVHRAKSQLLGIGLARLARAIGWPSVIEGPCIYLAPEQLTGAAVDARTDVFSLGIVLWELLTGEPLFYGHSPPDAMWSVLHGDIFPPSFVVPHLPHELDRIVLTALAPDPARRYPSTARMATELAELRFAPRGSDAFLPIRRKVASIPRTEPRIMLLPRRRFEMLN